VADRVDGHGPDDRRQRVAPLSPFEEQAGFTRALRVGERIVVSGTVGTEEDGSVSPDAGRQAERCFEQFLDYIGQLGGQPATWCGCACS